MKDFFPPFARSRFFTRVFFVLFLFCRNASVTAQAPLRMQDQFVVRNSTGALVVNQAIGLRVGILQGSAQGALVFQETHAVTTNANGLANVELGGGTAVVGSLAGINWTAGPYFLSTEFDVTGGSNYSLSSVQQLLSVPYALHATSASVALNGVPQGGAQGQVLTMCNGVPVWTNGGQCPALVSGLDCASSVLAGVLAASQPVAGATLTVPYSGGNGGAYPSQTLASSGVGGLTATLAAGSLLSGSGVLVLNLSGTPTSAGTATFTLSVGGQSCAVDCVVLGAGASSCGAANVLNPNLSYGTMTDQDGNTYKTIVVGGQEWMAENLAAGHYRNGDTLAMVGNNAPWGQGTLGAACWYGGDSANQCPYGRLYNWYAVADSRGLCPTGWHVPSDAEWNSLIGFIDPLYYPNVSGTQSTTAGAKLKSTSSAYWSASNVANNTTGFSALGSGYRSGVGAFTLIGSQGAWWSATSNSNFIAWFRFIYSGDANVGRSMNSKSYGYSVRCVRD